MKKNTQRIICLNTEEIFDSVTEASKKYNIERSNISRCCTGRRKSAGIINGDKAIWMYYGEYLLLNNDEIENILNKNNKRKVICLNTREIFDFIADASKKYNIDKSSIGKCCIGIHKSAGVINGEKAIWMYYDEYLSLNNDEIENILIKAIKRIICLNTSEVFGSVKEASEKYNIHHSSIFSCCKKQRKSAGKINGEKAIWMFYEDYLK